MKLTETMRKDLLFYAEQNPGKAAAHIYPEPQFGFDFQGYSSMAAAFAARQKLADEGVPVEEMLVVNLWKLEENK